MKAVAVASAAACLVLVEISAFHLPWLNNLGPQTKPGSSPELYRPQQHRVRRGVGPTTATVEGTIASGDTADLNGQRQVLGVETEPADDAEWPYDWRKHWYAVGYDRDIVAGPKPFSMSIFDEPLVLFRDTSGALQCVSDFCPHRASKLSEGQVTEEGNIECLYHGWQFEGAGGSCTKIPQLPEGGIPPRAANLRVYPVAVSEGVVYVWMGDNPWGEGAKDILPVPSSADRLDENKPFNTYEFMYDLPYDWSYLAENLLDPAHLHFSHDKTLGGGNKKCAGPIEFEIVKEGDAAPGPGGFKMLAKGALFTPEKVTTAEYTWEAPGVTRLRTKPGADGAFSGASLHCIPLGKGRSRILFQTYGFGFKGKIALFFKIFALKPLFLRHLNSCKVLEQDAGLICAQEDHVARTGKTLSDSFIPIKSSDAMAVEYRKWLDRVGHGMPFFQGWKKSKQPSDLSNHEDVRRYNHRSQESRYTRHVLLCPTTRRALAKVKLTKKAGFTAAAVLAAASLLLLSNSAGATAAAAAATTTAASSGGGGLAALVSRVGGAKASFVAAVGAVCSLGLAAAAGKLEGCFYTNYERHPALA